MIFVSYSRSDSDFVYKLVDDLEMSGLRTWIDHRDVQAGQRWDKTVQDNLDSCDVVLLILSPQSVGSDEVMYEVNHALDLGKLIVPILHQECRIPYRLASLQYIDVTSGRGYPLDEIISALASTQKTDFNTRVKDSTFELFAPYLRRLVFEYEHWSDFNQVTQAGPRPKKNMMIGKMASANLYHDFIPSYFDRVTLGAEGWKTISSGVVRDLEEQWLKVSEPAPRGRILLMLGDYGTGKSSYALTLAYRVARETLVNPTPSGLIPLYVDLQDFRRFGKIEEFLVGVLTGIYQIRLDATRLRSLLEGGRLLLIFDGFDEMVSRSNLDDTLYNFREIKRVSLPSVKTILTSRAHYFRSNREAEQVMEGSSEPIDNPLVQEIKGQPEFEVVILREFTDAQIQNLIERRMGERQVERVWGEITSRYNLRDLARRPVLLDMILKTIPSIALKKEEINIAHIYDGYTTLWFERDDWRSNLYPDGKRELTKRLAWRIVERWTGQSTRDPRPDENGGVDLHALITEIGTIPPAWLKPKERFPGDDLDRIDYDLRTCSFLRRDPKGQYTFSHRSFLEYFCALYLIDSINEENPALLAHRLASYSNSISWEWPSSEIVSFILNTLRNDYERRSRLLQSTHKTEGYGGNGLTLVWEAARTATIKESIGCNLRGCVAYALELSKRNLDDSDLSEGAFASPDLTGTMLKNSRWRHTALRINLVYDVDFDFASSSIVAASGNGVLSKWNTKSDEHISCLRLKTEYLFDVSISVKKNLVAFTTWDGHIVVHSLSSGERQWSKSGDGAGAGKILFSQRANYLTAGSGDGWVRVWDCDASGHEIASWKIGSEKQGGKIAWHSGVHALAFHPAEEFVGAVKSRELYLLPLGKSGKLRLFPLTEIPGGHLGTALAFSPDGSVAAIGGWQTDQIHLIKISSGELIFQTRTGINHCYALRFLSDGSKLAVGGSYGITIIDLSSGDLTHLLSNTRVDIKTLSATEDGTQLVSGGFDGKVRLWDLSTGRLLKVIDLGINCFNADITAASGFAGSQHLSAEWETWWTGTALHERLLRCGAIDRNVTQLAWYDSKKPRACWDGMEYTTWESALEWLSPEEAYLAKHGGRGRIPTSYAATDFFSGSAAGWPSFN